MATYTVMDRAEVDEILREWGLGKISAGKGGRGGGDDGRYLLSTTKGKFHLRVDEAKSEIEVRREIDLLNYLRKQGFPCPQPLADKSGRHYRQIGGKCVSVFKRIDGIVPRPEAITTAQLKNLGRAMADLHLLGKGYKKGIDNRFGFDRVYDLYGEVRDKLPTYFRKTVRTLDEEVDYLRYYLEGKLPKGIIHGDWMLENVLFKGERVVGVLDFETSCRGKFVFDLASAVNSLCFRNAAYELERFESLIAGYESVRTLSLAEWDAFPNELRFSALRSTVTRLKGSFVKSDDSPRSPEKSFEGYYDRLRILRREETGGMEALLMAMATGYDYRKYQKVKAGDRRR